MADGDQRIEVLEDEMKVLKGEVSRTLVDLRALLMQEDSPLMAGGLLKRVAASNAPTPSITTQVNLAPVADPTASNISIVAPAAPDQESSVVSILPGQESSALAGLPGLGGIEMPEAPGAPDEALFPSQGDESSMPPGAPPADTTPPPGAPSAGDFSPPGDAPEPSATSDSNWEEEREEERARQRKVRAREDDAQDEEKRTRRRENDRSEDQADQERRDRRRREQEDDDKRDDRKRQGQGDDDKRENRRRQDQEDDDRRDDRRRRDQEDDDRREDQRREGRIGQYESELEDELERFRRVRGRGEELEDEMERLSNSRARADDWETGPDAESDMDPLDQETEGDGDAMGLDDRGADSDYAKDDGFGADDRSGDFIPSASLDQDSEYDRGQPLPRDSEDETGDGYAATYDNGYADNRDEDLGYPPALGPPVLGSDDNLDSYEYQEEPKINGNNGSRRPRRPDADRQEYGESYYEDRNQEFDREPQSPPRSQRMSRPMPDGRGQPRGRRPAPDSYGYAPNGMNGQWGQPPQGYQQWPAPQGWTPEPSPMDLNLVSSLVRWASLAKHRVGEKRLTDIIQLYVESRSATPGLKEALTHIASIVDDQPPESGQSAQETLDLIAHLHGILTAALPVPEVPRVPSQINFVAGNGNATGSGNGDW